MEYVSKYWIYIEKFYFYFPKQKLLRENSWLVYLVRLKPLFKTFFKTRSKLHCDFNIGRTTSNGSVLMPETTEDTYLKSHWKIMLSEGVNTKKNPNATHFWIKLVRSGTKTIHLVKNNYKPEFLNLHGKMGQKCFFFFSKFSVKYF